MNPFTQVVEAIRFGLYGEVNLPAIGWTTLAMAIFMALGLFGYDPARDMSHRRLKGS